MNYKIGITGGIGAGKSTVAKIFSTLGIPVYDADVRARRLMESSLEIRSRIASLLGSQAYRGGQLNRLWIAEKVFSDPWTLARLNAVVHPAVEQDYQDWHTAQKTTYTVKEAALIFDAGSYLTLDAVMVVSASEKVRIDRVMNRDQGTREQVLRRMDKQWPEDRRLLLADFVIDNNGDQLLIPQIIRIHEQLLHID